MSLIQQKTLPNKLTMKSLLFKANLKKLFIKRGKDNALKKVNKYLPFIVEHSKTELNLILIKTETVPLNLIWVKEESLKVGMKDLLL